MSTPSAQQVAQQFVTFYYDKFDRGDWKEMKSLYRGTSMFTFQDNEFIGVDQVMEKITNLPFKKVQHVTTSCLAQPSIHPTAILVSVSGYLKVDEEPHPLPFSQVFQLIQEANTYYVQNDMFSLNIG